MTTFDIVYANRSWYVVNNATGETVHRVKGDYQNRTAERAALAKRDQLNTAADAEREQAEYDSDDDAAARTGIL